MTRLPCCVPFCRATRGDRKGDPLVPGMEWICSKHWRHVDRRTKRFKRLAEKVERKTNAECEAIEREAQRCAAEHGGGVHVDIIERFNAAAERRDRARAACDRAWERCKRIATEAAVGIG